MVGNHMKNGWKSHEKWLEITIFIHFKLVATVYRYVSIGLQDFCIRPVDGEKFG